VALGDGWPACRHVVRSRGVEFSTLGEGDGLSAQVIRDLNLYSIRTHINFSYISHFPPIIRSLFV
jgi:hypothetical protein